MVFGVGIRQNSGGFGFLGLIFLTRSWAFRDLPVLVF